MVCFYLVLDLIPLSVHNLNPFVPGSVQCYNTLSQATNGFTAWKSNQHLHHLILQPKNTSADITSTQGASNYLTSGLLDSYMAITQGVLMLEQKKNN